VQGFLFTAPEAIDGGDISRSIKSHLRSALPLQRVFKLLRELSWSHTISAKVSEAVNAGHGGRCSATPGFAPESGRGPVDRGDPTADHLVEFIVRASWGCSPRREQKLTVRQVVDGLPERHTTALVGTDAPTAGRFYETMIHGGGCTFGDRHSPFGPAPLQRLHLCRRRRARLLSRWPPSAAQTGRAVLPHPAFT